MPYFQCVFDASHVEPGHLHDGMSHNYYLVLCLFEGSGSMQLSIENLVAKCHTQSVDSTRTYNCMGSAGSAIYVHFL